LVSGLGGAAVQVVAQVSLLAVPEWALPLSKLLLYQGYPLFVIMGGAMLLLPRFFEWQSQPIQPESLTLSPDWGHRAGFALCCGGLVLVGFVVEAVGHPSWGNGLRAVGVLLYFAGMGLKNVGGKSNAPSKTPSRCRALGLPLAIFFIPLAYAAVAIWPERASSLLHILFITGFSLLSFIVVSCAMQGQSDQDRRFCSRWWPVLLVTGLMVLAVLTLISGDWLPHLRLKHYAYAAITWAIAVAVWVVVATLPGRRPTKAEG
jgi:hypothetical protein